MESEVRAQVFLLSGSVGVLVALVVILIVSFVNSTQRQEEIRKHYDEVSAAYEILLDGDKVDADTINVDWYGDPDASSNTLMSLLRSPRDLAKLRVVFRAGARGHSAR